MATVRFLGAAQEVTGSCHMIEAPTLGRILFDCGMHQGGSRVDREQQQIFLFDPPTIDAVFLSHAHLDHSGMLPTVITGLFIVLMPLLIYYMSCCSTQ
jgi:metallo-beta-lactamase family protein